jgi:hypothetical protein
MTKGTLPISDAAKNFRYGRYRHFKGGLYDIICIAQDSENMAQELVIYKSVDHGYICARPLGMFLEHVERDGYKGPRFTFLDER